MKLPFRINVRGKLVDKGKLSLLGQLGQFAQAMAMPKGAVPTYDRDIDVSAMLEETKPYKHDKFVITPRGKLEDSASLRVFGQRVVVPTFQVVSNPTIRISEVKRRRFNVIDRAVQKARAQLMAQEDTAIFAALDAAVGKPLVITRKGKLKDRGW